MIISPDDEERGLLLQLLDDYIYVKQKQRDYYAYDTVIKQAKEIDLEIAYRARRDLIESKKEVE